MNVRSNCDVSHLHRVSPVQTFHYFFPFGFSVCCLNENIITAHQNRLFQTTAFRVRVMFYFSAHSLLSTALMVVSVDVICVRIAGRQAGGQAGCSARCSVWLEEEETMAAFKHSWVPDSGIRSKHTFKRTINCCWNLFVRAAFITGSFLWDFNRVNAN